MLKRIRSGMGLGAIVAVATGCADRTGQRAEDSDATQPGAEVPAPAPTPAPAPATPSDATFTDATIVRALDAVNTAEIQGGELALERSSDEDVRRFAQRMITDHRKLASELQAATSTGTPETDTTTRTPDDTARDPTTTPEAAVPSQRPAPGDPNAPGAEAPGTDTGSSQRSANELIQRLQHEADSTQSELGKLSGAEFDRAYIEHQVSAHQEALEMIDRQLMPAAQDPQLRQTLEKAQREVEAHLEEARQIQQRLGSSGASGTSTQN